ncbi:helix-turn-helix domain-containing protein [Methylobacterium sp. Leaf118]|uniref:helix-turn-helix domain-containing protein n=1 Tax=Methylobacterium sp. Leaf118 TaxID=2876562 RepID=UPI001E2A4F5C|nr:helix-turn-helix domain-containing protein [Methylobacterium sp. Leaf118]
MSAEKGLPHFFLKTSGLPPGEAFEQWRTLLAPMYAVSPATPSAPLPSGTNIAYQIGDLVTQRSLLSTQRLQRDSKRVEAGPDQYMVQLYRSGRFQGTVAGKPVSASRGTVTFIPRRSPLDGTLDRADVIGIAVPSFRLHGLPIEGHGLRFDTARNRLLAARLLDVYRRLPTTRAHEAPALADEFVAFLRRLLDGSKATDVLDGHELDGGLMALARMIVQANLSRPDLSPEFIAGQMQVSRATLYRLFEPEGGVMHFVQGERLEAVRDALADPLETRTLSRLAEVFGFSSISQLSRSFRHRYGVPPQAWRGERRVVQRISGQGTVQHVWKWLREA